MPLPTLDARSRVLFFAPHPDDESLAAGVFLQRAIAAGAAMRIVYATDGEKNCWPQRFLERRVRLRAIDQRRWGARRQQEALAALSVLGITPEQVNFLSLPDQGLTDLLLRGDEGIVQRLSQVISNWRPTHLLAPSACDTHPDHSALAVLLRLACDNLREQCGLIHLDYLVHGQSETFARAASRLTQTDDERDRKGLAIARHATQVALSRRRFLSYAKRPERFVCGEKNFAFGDGPILSFIRSRRSARLQIAFALKPLRREETSLYLLGRDTCGKLRRWRGSLPGRSAPLHLLDCVTGEITALGRYEGDAFHAAISLPLDRFSVHEPIFLKLDRRVWFFDEAGWLEIGAAIPRPARRRQELHEIAFA